MPVFDLFSKRKRREKNQGKADVYQYDVIPEALRVQVVHILNDALGNIERYNSNDAHERWKTIHDVMAREKGVFQLQSYIASYQAACIDWFMQTDTDGALDMIELSFKVIDVYQQELHDWEIKQKGMDLKCSEAVEELNIRFREHAVGYQLEQGQLVRIDSQLVHSEIIKPALTLLGDPLYRKANEDFLLAHTHYREKRYKDAVVAAQRAFESTLKAICTKNGWPMNAGDRASDLIKTIRKNQLFPDYLDAGFETYIAMLKTGLPDVRNNAGGHGAAPSAEPVPHYVASYAIHLTASNIILLAEAMKRYNK